jgi:hypothetical protein
MEDIIENIIKEYRDAMNWNIYWSVLRDILTKHLSTSKVKEECPKCKYYRENYDNWNYV